MLILSVAMFVEDPLYGFGYMAELRRQHKLFEQVGHPAVGAHASAHIDSKS